MRQFHGRTCKKYLHPAWFRIFVVSWSLMSILRFYTLSIAWTTIAIKNGVTTRMQNTHNNDTTFSPSSNVKERQVNKQPVLLLMDALCEYHGQYLSDRARDVYNIRCVPVLSTYMTGYLKSLQEQQHQGGEDEEENNGDSDATGILPSLLPYDMLPMPSSSEEVTEWRRQLVIKLGGDDEHDDDRRKKKNYDDPIEIIGLICESDPGLDNAEQLSKWLNVTNHCYSQTTRNKFLTISKLASNKIKTVNQKLCTTVEEAVDFAKILEQNQREPPPQQQQQQQPQQRTSCICVVKPIRGCASDDVFLCDNTDSVRSAFQVIKGSTVLGSPKKKHDTVLVQEYAVGQEYAIDTVSKEGEMKIAAVWIYDKRPKPPTITQQNMIELSDDDAAAAAAANSSGRNRQVYYATKLYDDDIDDDENSHPLLPVIYQYLDDCFHALDIRWGITHSELIITSDGPRLIEVNTRQHNMDFIPLTDNAIGYNLYDLLLAAYLGDKNNIHEKNENEKVNWDDVPNYPLTRMNGAMVHLVNDKSGILKRLNQKALYEIQAMDSVWDLEVYEDFLHPGVSHIEPTVDIKSDAGWIQILHPDRETFDRDYDRIMDLMPTLFEV